MYSCVNLRETTSDIPTNLFGGEILFPSQPFLFCAGCKENKQSLFGTKMTALFSKANFLFGNSVQQKISAQKKILNKQFVFSVNKRGDFVLPTLVSCAHVHTYTVHIAALHMSRSLYTLRASYISLLRTFYISRVGWEGLIKFEAFVFLALTLPPPYSRVLWKTRYPSASMPIQIMNGHQLAILDFWDKSYRPIYGNQSCPQDEPHFPKCSKKKVR